MSFLSSILGGGDGAAAGNASNGADTVERLVDRLQSSTLLEDRRDAIRGLKGLSKQFKVEVGTQGMDVLISTVDRDRSDNEVVANGLEALLNVIATDAKEGDSPSDSDLGVQFTEIFVKKQENIATLLGLLEEYDFPVRWPTVKLLTTLLTNKSTRVQECVLESPGSVPLLMDLLSDSREIIRNDGLLLLTRLSSRNTQIQRMVAFQGGMERLLEIITEEGNSDGGIVVEDCILLLLNLIRSNSSNQSYFRETSLTPRLRPFFDFTNDTAEWSAQKIRNVVLMLRLVRAFVSPIQSQAQSTMAAQRAFAQCGIFTALSQLMFAANLHESVILEMMGTVAELLRGDATNQSTFVQVAVAQRPALLLIILWLVEDKRAVELRLAALYILQCVLLQNEAVQKQIVTTLMPSEAQAGQPSTVTAGQLLCRGLFSGDGVTMWCSASALVSCIELAAMKEELVRVQLSVRDSSPVALIHQTGFLAARKDLPFRARIGLLMLLSHWLNDCPISVAMLLSSAPCIQFLTSTVEEQSDSHEQTVLRGFAALIIGLCLLARGVTATGEFTQESLLEIAQKRIRLENFAEALSAISQSEVFMRAAQSHYPPAEVVFDYQYSQLFRQTSDNVLRIVRGDLEIASSAPPSPRSDRLSPDVQQTSTHILEHDAVVTSYKELIRDQDSQLISMREELDTIKKQRAREQEERSDLARQLKELQMNTGNVTNGDDDIDGRRQQQSVNGGADTQEIMTANTTMARQLQELNATVGQLSQENSHLRVQLQTAQLEKSHAQTDTQSRGDEGLAAQHSAAMEAAQRELERLRESLRNAESQLAEERRVSSSREEEVTSLFGRLQVAEQETERVRSEALAATEKLQDVDDGDNLQAKCKRLEAQLRELAHRHGKLSEDNQALEGEHDDLLVLLAEQDSKIAKLREKVANHGIYLTESEEEDDDEDDQEDSDEASDEDK
eukprot:scpid33244/ scgid10350/ General vesicular transport factor p115; Protein USO1 homolog; Transcytosis-associated protein; Vesicle-docking protein